MRNHLGRQWTMRRFFLLIAFLAVVSPVAASAEYAGLCEASAGAFLDNDHFAVASDETNVLKIYRRGQRDPVGNADMKQFTGFKKSDLEASATIDGRIYWMSSHSPKKNGDQDSKREVFFATKIEITGGKPTLVPAGKPIKSLRDLIATAANVPLKGLNIEALAATSDGGLLIGLRGPLRDAKAIVIPFKNPTKVVDDGVAPDFGTVELLDLEGRGLRSMDLTGNADSPYVIIAGSVADSADPFVLFKWAGPGAKPMKVTTLESGFRAEAAMAVPGTRLLQLLSDDGNDDTCNDEDTPEVNRRFRSIDVTWQ